MTVSVRSELNDADANRIGALFRDLKFGDLLNLLLAASETGSNTIGGAVSATVGANIAAFTDPPAAAEMATLRTFVNALKADAASTITLLNQLRTAALSVSRTTETGITVTSDIATLANAPSSLINAQATAGGSTGAKTLLRGPISGAGAVIPKPGECVWDGNLKVLFNHADAVTAASFLYATAADATASVLQRTLGSVP